MLAIVDVANLGAKFRCVNILFSIQGIHKVPVALLVNFMTASCLCLAADKLATALSNIGVLPDEFASEEAKSVDVGYTYHAPGLAI